MASQYVHRRWSDVPREARAARWTAVTVENRCQYAVHAYDTVPPEDRFGKFHQCAGTAMPGQECCEEHSIALAMPERPFVDPLVQQAYRRYGLDFVAAPEDMVMPIPKAPRAPIPGAVLDGRARRVAIRRTRGQCWRESPRRPLAWFRARTDQEILKWNGIGVRYAAEIRLIRDTVSDDDVRAMMNWEPDPEEIPFGWAEHAPTISMVGG